MILYWLTIAAHALTDSIHFVGHTWGTIVFGLLVSVTELSFAWREKRQPSETRRAFFERRIARELGRTAVIIALAWVPFFFCFWYYEPYSFQSLADTSLSKEQKKSFDLQSQLTSVGSELSSCNVNHGADQNRISDLQSRINDQQFALTAQQSSVNVCLNNSIDKLKAQQKAFIFMKESVPNSNKWPYYQILLFTSNQTVAVNFRLHCPVPIADVTAGLLNTTTGIGGGGSGRRSPNDWDISIGAPALSPSTPLEIIVYYTKDEANPDCIMSEL